jgi:serine/threonine protein kinase
VTEGLAPGVGEAFGSYTIESPLGRGGMGAVYLATHARLDRKVALKVIAPELAHDEAFRARFLRETQLAASLEHPNVIPIYDAGEIDGVLYLSMRYVRGPSLRMLLRERGALSVPETLAIARQIGGALDAAHAAGLVHRDVKPANVLLTESGEEAFLCDFGLAKRRDSQGLTQTGSFLGTADYAAPEQIEGRVVDGRADVYSLGCVLFHCLAGRAPFAGDTEYAVLHAHVAEAPTTLSSLKPDLPQTLDAVLLKAMAKEPDGRYATAGALAATLEGALEGTRVTPVVPPPQGRGRLIAAATAAVLLAVTGILLGVFLTRDSNGDTTPTVGAVAASLERILRDSAASRASIGNALHDGFQCRIGLDVAGRRMQRVVESRRRELARVSSLGPVPAAAVRPVALLQSALRESINADAGYRNGFRFAKTCPPTSAYFTRAALADARATKAKQRFVTAFNALALQFGLRPWEATEL